MHVVKREIDEGEYVFRRDFLFDKAERTPIDYEERQIMEERKDLIPWIEKIMKGEKKIEETEFKQVSKIEEGTYFPRLSTEVHGHIDWTLSAQELERFILAFSHPYKGASTTIKGKKIRILDCNLHKSCNIHPFLFGLILFKGKESLRVACKGGIIQIKLEDINTGTTNIKINQGDRFVSSLAMLKEAFSTRVYFRSGEELRRYHKLEESLEGQ